MTESENSPAPLLVETPDAIRIIRLNRPAQRNALSQATLEAFVSAMPIDIGIA